MILWSEGLITRLYQVAGVTTQRALAEALEVAETTLSNHKARGKFPEKLVRRAADKFGANYDWLATGKPPFMRVRKVSPEGTDRALRLMGIPQEVRDEYEQVFQRLCDSPSLTPWVAGLLKILASDSEGSRVGIQENINAFLTRLGLPEVPRSEGQRPQRVAKKSAG